MAKEKEPKRLCRCGCGKMLSARAERRHRDGQVPPRIAAVQRNQSRVSRFETHESTVTFTVASSSHQVRTSGHGQDDNIDIDVDMLDSEHQPASPFDNCFDAEAMVSEETIIAACDEPATVQVNISVGKAKAAVWTEWRARRENATVSDDEDDDLPGLVTPEDDEDDDPDEDSELDGDSEPDYQSVDDHIEAEWEKEWAEMGESTLTSFRVLSLSYFINMAEKELTDEDLDVLRAFTFKTEENLSDKTFERMRHTFPKLSLDSFKITRSRAHFLASLSRYHTIVV